MPINPLRGGTTASFLCAIVTVMATPALSEPSNAAMRKFSVDALSKRNATTDLPYLEFLRVESMSAYLYELPVGTTDEQTPHDQDEVYYVVSGRAKLTVDGETTSVKTGDIFFVRKFAEHRFRNITEGLKLLVVFAPPDTE